MRSIRIAKFLRLNMLDKLLVNYLLVRFLKMTVKIA